MRWHTGMREEKGKVGVSGVCNVDPVFLGRCMGDRKMDRQLNHER